MEPDRKEASERARRSPGLDHRRELGFKPEKSKVCLGNKTSSFTGHSLCTRYSFKDFYVLTQVIGVKQPCCKEEEMEQSQVTCLKT